MNTTIYILIWPVCAMVYLANMYCPILPIRNTRQISLLRDMDACSYIVEKDDYLTERNLPLFMNVLFVLDFLSYTGITSILIGATIYFIDGLR